MSSDPASARPKDLPAVIGPYRVVRELGTGRLGPILLAKHRATGRLVALRVVKPEWACFPRYVARLTRDALAASLVRHPNLVAVEDFGEAAGRVYFATEYVEGQSLADLAEKAGGKLAVAQALPYALQAARGLRFAHGQGLTHGDIRPEALIVDRGRTTRLADLGLTATPATIDADDARPIPVGPEAQAEADAAPFRADVRGLGLTLVKLLTGKADAHPTALLNAGLPMNLVELIRTMVEPKPGSGDLAQVVPALERFLNAGGKSSTLPTEDDTAALEESLRTYRAAPSAKIRTRIVLAAGAAGALVVLMGLLAGRPLFAASVLGLGLLTALADFLTAGATGRSALFPKVRALAFESRGGDWLLALAALGVFVAGLVALNLHGAWIAFLVLAVIVAVLMHVTLDRPIAAEQGPAIAGARALAAKMRLRGVDEETLRRFVRTTAGADWEGFFEAVFGYEAMLAARDPGESGLRGLFRRGRSLPWRDAASAWLDARGRDRRRERWRAYLPLIEERGLVAEGVNLLTARRKGRRIAEAMLAVAPEGQDIGAAVRRAFENPEEVLVGQEAEADEGVSFRPRVIDLLFGPRVCFLLGAALLAGFLVWVRQNEVISQQQVAEVARGVIKSSDPLGTLQGARIDVKLDGATRPLEVGFLPGRVTRVFNGFGPGAVGLMLIVAALMGGRRTGLVALPCAAIALLGSAYHLPALTILGVAGPLVVVLFGWDRDW